MNAHRFAAFAVFAAVSAVWVFALSACAPYPVYPGQPGGAGSALPGWIGRIVSIEGPNAFIGAGNRNAVQIARVGQFLLPGDRFFTGERTRMKVDFASGGYVELDENTDPSLFQDLRCLAISLFRSGRIFVDKAAACVESLDTKSQQFSKVAYEVMDGGRFVRLTVVEGEAQTLQPEIARAPAGWRIDVNSRRVMDGGAYRVSDEEIRRTIGWTRYFRERQQPYRPPFGVPADRWPLPDWRLPPRQEREPVPPRGEPSGVPGGFERPGQPPPAAPAPGRSAPGGYILR